MFAKVIYFQSHLAYLGNNIHPSLRKWEPLWHRMWFKIIWVGFIIIIRIKLYPAELEIMETTESLTSVSDLDLLLSIGRELHTSTDDKRDDFNFHITNSPLRSSNIQPSPAYGVFISQPIRYARACSSYERFILRTRRLSSKLIKQGYLVERLISSFRKFYGRYRDLI